MENTVKIPRSVFRAKAIYRRLMELPRPEGMSNLEWTKKAGVNMSFFTNLKNGSEPSVGNLRAVLEQVGLTIPEFFVNEADGRLIRQPSQQALEAALRRALPGLPRNPDKRAEYLAEVVQGVLELQEDQLANIHQVDFRAAAEERKAGEARVTTKPAGSARPRTA